MSKSTAKVGEVVPIGDPILAKVTQEWVELTPGMAEEFLGRNHGNRNIRPQKVRALARDIANGDWRLTGEAIKFAYDGTMIDGQHRCAAVIEADTPIRVLVVRGLDVSAREVLDTGAKRTAADALRFAGHSSSPTITAAVARIATMRARGAAQAAMDAIGGHFAKALEG